MLEIFDFIVVRDAKIKVPRLSIEAAFTMDGATGNKQRNTNARSICTIHFVNLTDMHPVRP